jgi:hypothetical protein
MLTLLNILIFVLLISGLFMFFVFMFLGWLSGG